MVNGTDLKETETKISAYESANRTSIQANADRSDREHKEVSDREELSRQYRESARLAAQQEAEEEGLERERQKADLIRDLASSQGSADKILARNKAAALKRSSARRRTEEERFVAASMPRFAGVEVEDERPFDPLDGAGEESSLYVVRSEYDDPYALLGEVWLMIGGLISFVGMLLPWRVDFLCMMCTNVGCLKRILGWDVFYPKNWLKLKLHSPIPLYVYPFWLWPLLECQRCKLSDRLQHVLCVGTGPDHTGS